ncbi:MAG: hypothetical protein LBM93_01380 [Oscillospiraceae bacterium]|jgi:hypothetical protein|nr:hypothetical protein [Oscillospiraceae bacterium]
MNTDKAYILGLVIGGGIFSNNTSTFTIRLPYKQWGDIQKNAERAGKIGADIIKVVKPMLMVTYGIDATYEMLKGEWRINCSGNLTDLKSELGKYGIKAEGDLRSNPSLSIAKLTEDLVDDTLIRKFIAGIADTIGSTKETHRRFTDDVQIISFEISGFNYAFVCELCQLLHSVGCYPDQVAWNHPNIHCASNPYYKQWTKGFKIRVKLDQYEKFGAFLFRTKAVSANENRKKQKQETVSVRCEDRTISIKPSCVHEAENSPKLPETIRGGHYIHNRHFCAVLGCEHAPCDKIAEHLKHAGDYITPFPILYKDTKTELEKRVETEPLYKNRKYTPIITDVKTMYEKFLSNKTALIYGNGHTTGYPMNNVAQAIAFLVAAEIGKLNGNRVSGNFEYILKEFLQSDKNMNIEIRRPDLLTPLIFVHGEYAAMVGAENPAVYTKLIVPDMNNKYKISVRKITEDDLI